MEYFIQLLGNQGLFIATKTLVVIISSLFCFGPAEITPWLNFSNILKSKNVLETHLAYFV